MMPENRKIKFETHLNAFPLHQKKKKYGFRLKLLKKQCAYALEGITCHKHIHRQLDLNAKLIIFRITHSHY